MKTDLRTAFMIALLVATVSVLLFHPTTHAYGFVNETQTDQNDLLPRRLLLTACVAGLVVVLILIITQIRGTWQRKAEPNGDSANRKTMSEKTMAFRCRKCGRVFKEELTKECTIECPLCGHVWRWPPPIELKLLEDRMFAFALDPEKPRGDLTFATKVISRLSKSFAERILVAGKYLDGGEMLCICEKCGEIHITQKSNRGVWGICVGCKSVLLIW